MNIYAEDADNSAQFNSGSSAATVVPHDLSSRVRTIDFVNWSLDGDETLWTVVEEAGEKEQTPDLSSLVQDIVDRSGWASGNALSFIIYGTGNRTAISRDKDASKAPVLCLSYTYSGTLDQGEPAGLSGGAPTTQAGSDGKITGTTALMEYRLSGAADYAPCQDGETTGLAAGLYEVRYAEAEGYNPSLPTEVEVPAYSDVQAAPTGLAGVPLTKAAAADGKITGVTAAMEYKASYETVWTACAGTEVTGLTAGVYNVRYAPTAGAAAGDAVDVVVSAVTKVAMTFCDDPAISADATNARGFTWYTVAESDSDSDLQVVKMDSDTPDFEGAGVLNFTGTCSVPSNAVSTNLSQEQEYLHKAVAAGLEADTAYFFRVGDAARGLWSETGTFTTAAADGSFTFLDLADPQAKELDEALLAASTFQTAVETVPDADFITINGDIVDKGSLEYEWDWLFNNMSDVMMNYAIAPIAGNHENQTNSFVNHFNLCPAAGSATATGVYYSFDYSNAHFVMLNTNENSTTYSDFSVEQVEWMKADIQAAADEGMWIIVLLHKGPYTTSNHATDSDIMGATGVRTLIAPIFAELGVDLVLQGHDHIYARSKPVMADGTADAPTCITELYEGQSVDYQLNPDGSIYLIPSTAGPKVYYKNTSPSLVDAGYYDLFDVADESHSAVYGSDPSDASRPVRSMVDNFESITIDGDTLTVVSYEIDHGGLLSGTEDPYVIDTFGIRKDFVAPVITVEGISDGQTVALNENVTVTWSADDGTGTGIASAYGDIESGALLDTSVPGEYALTFTAADNAGNTVEKTVRYTVAYAFGGFLAPVGNGNLKAGRTIPVKFSLSDCAGLSRTDAAAKLYIAKVGDDGSLGEEQAAVSSGAERDNLFRVAGKQYIFNLSTKSMTAGAYQLRVELSDGTSHTVQIVLK